MRPQLPSNKYLQPVLQHWTPRPQLVISGEMARYRRVLTNIKKTLAKAWKATAPVLPPIDIPRAAFIDLTGELRNRIYRLVLVEEKKIELSKLNRFSKPGLLSTCKQIRSETVKIFYVENKWEIDCPDGECSLRHNFFERDYLRHGIARSDIKTYCSDSGSYYKKNNLLHFIKSSHEDSGDRHPSYISNADPVTSAITGAFEIAERMRKQSWADVEKVLEVYLEQVARRRQGWSVVGVDLKKISWERTETRWL